jgi:Mrp family chromosome partitioning ATPase
MENREKKLQHQGALMDTQSVKDDSDRSKTPCDTCDKKNCSAAKRNPGENEDEFENRRKLQSRLCRIRHKIIILSGKGGVGKSTVAVNLAAALSLSGKRVGLLDVDIHGPSIPTMLGLENQTLQTTAEGLIPVDVGGIKVMSMGFLLKTGDDAVIWRGPLKTGVIRQFLKDVEWGDLDYLIIDSPPGTGDEPLSVIKLIGSLDGAVIVTTPQRVSAVDVRKSVTFCRRMHVPVLGIVENMSGFVCPKCGAVTPILRSGAGRQIASDMGLVFLGSIPIDPGIAESGDAGIPFLQMFAESPTAEMMADLMEPLMELDRTHDTETI